MSDSHHPALNRRDVWLTEDVLREAEPARLVERPIALLRESGIPACTPCSRLTARAHEHA